MEHPPLERLIRAPVDAEAEDLAGLFAAAWEAGYRGLMPDALVDRRATVRGVLERRGRKREPFPGRRDRVLECGGHLVASSSAGPTRDETPEGGLAEIYSFYVHPAHWRQGHGRVLFRHTCTELAQRGFDNVILWCLTDNERARRFYEEMGFRVEIERISKTVEEFELDHTRYRMPLPLTEHPGSSSLQNA